MSLHGAVALRPAWSSSDDDNHAAPVSSPPLSPDLTWPRPTRYSDQPMGLGTRLFGVAGVALVALAIVGGGLITWRTYTAAPAPATLSVFDVTRPAAPPNPTNEIPPGPEELEKEKPQPELKTPKIDLPEIQIRNDNPVTLPESKRAPAPVPSVERTTAPESKPLPPAPQISTAKPTWQGLVLGALNKVKRYPRYAQSRRQQGAPWIRFTMDREGKVLSVRLDRSSGVRALDEEAMTLPKRAQPLPKPPEDVPGDLIELVVPVEFFLG